MAWQDDVLTAIKKAGVPVTTSSKEPDALIISTTTSDGEPVTITATKGSAQAVADLLGYPMNEKRYIIQAGAFAKKAYADAMAQTLRDNGFSAVVRRSGSKYIVQAGSYTVLNNAKLQIARLKKAGFDCFIKEE